MSRMFSRLLDWCLELSVHRHAPWYLGALSFAESSFFPIPPDIMLAPMVLAERRKARAGSLGPAPGYRAIFSGNAVDRRACAATQ